LSASGLLELIAEKYHMSKKTLLKGRARHKAYIRFAAMVYFRRQMSLTLPQIGRVFGRHHATVIHGIATHDNLVDTNDVEFLAVREKVLKIIDEHT